MESCIYEGHVRHRRFKPVKNSFRYSVFFMYLDLAELQQVFNERWFWSVERPNVAMFRRKDHFGNSDVDMDSAVRNLVEKETGKRPQGPVRLLAHLRYFGHYFNPVCFYYCFDSKGEHVDSIVAEVTNTPWNERHLYVLGEQMNRGGIEHKRYLLDKDFHVSPFMDMNFQYDWRFNEPGNSLNVHFRSLRDGELFFDATLTTKRKEITGGALAKVLTGYPPMTMKVVAMIYWQALKLKLKGASFYTHPDKLESTTGGKA